MTGNEDDFVGEFETKRANDGYGLVMDKGTAEKQEMAQEFDAPDVGTMDTAADEEEPAAPALDVPAESDAPATAEVPAADSLGEGESIVGSADPVVGGPIAESTVKGEALPAAEPAKEMSFGEAFKKYRALGEKTFPWTNPKTGKTSIYSTALKSEKAKPLPKAAPVAAPAEEPHTQAIAVEVFRLQDEPAPATGPARSTGGIGPDLNPAMQPKPGAKGIYANVGVSAPQKQVAPINVTGKDGNARPAESVAEVMAAPGRVLAVADVYGVVAEEVFTADRDTAVDVQPLGAMLLGEYVRAKSDRQNTELRWLDDLRQYKGQYSDEEKKLMRGSSRAFVRKTRTKVKTVDARVADMLFPAGGQRNWNIAPTPIPNLSTQQQQAVAQMLQAAEQAGKQIDDAAIKEAVDRVAKEAAQKMADLVHDQLTETRYRKEALKAIHDCHLYGTGILKGPAVDRKARTVFKKDKNGQFRASTEYYVTPEIEHVPLWDAFPDMSSAELDNCRYFWQRHIMSAADLAELSDRPGFKSASDRIRTYLRAHPTGHTTALYSDSELRKIGNRITADIVHSGYEVLERWGWLTGEQLCSIGLRIDEDRKHESFFGCVWMLANGEVIRAHLANIDGTTWPYHLYHFDKDETSFFGEGLASIMRDDQQMINAATRMLLDNGALASGPMFEVNPSLLATSEAASLGDIHAWRIWLRNSQSPGVRAVSPISIDGRLADLQGIKTMFENNADETTAIPRYMSGENATAGAAGTASGMSMLMGTANIVIKDLITNWDEGITRPLIEAMYRWNMTHSKDDAIKGDYQVAATGTTSLVAKEVRARQLNEFAAMTANPLDAPFIKRDVLNRLRAEANELADVVKTEQEVEQEMKAAQNEGAQAMQQQMMQAQLQEAMAKAQEVAARAELQMARAKEALANVELTAAKKLDLTMEAMYAAMQAAGVAAQSPQVAPVADAMLQEAGFGQSAQPQSPNPATGQEGARAGIETAELVDGAQ